MFTPARPKAAGSSVAADLPSDRNALPSRNTSASNLPGPQLCSTVRAVVLTEDAGHTHYRVELEQGEGRSRVVQVGLALPDRPAHLFRQRFHVHLEAHGEGRRRAHTRADAAERGALDRLVQPERVATEGLVAEGVEKEDPTPIAKETQRGALVALAAIFASRFGLCPLASEPRRVIDLGGLAPRACGGRNHRRARPRCHRPTNLTGLHGTLRLRLSSAPYGLGSNVGT